MATQQRIDGLTAYVEQARNSLAKSTEQLETNAKLKESSVTITNESGDDLLQKAIDNADEAALIYKKILIYMENLLGRAQAGEDV